MKTIISCLGLVAMVVFTSGAFAQDPTPVQQPATAQDPTPVRQPASAQDPTPVQLPAPAHMPTLTSVEAKFDTTTSKKNQDTRLDVYVRNSDGQEVAKARGNAGRWDKNSSRTLMLQIEGSPSRSEVWNGSVALTLHPHGADKWEFNYKVTLKFSDGSVITKTVEGCSLTQHNAARTDSLK